MSFPEKYQPEKFLGKKFGMLTPYKEAAGPTTDRGRQAFWLCRCDCGGVAKVRQDRLLSGKTKSCGCLKTAHQDHLREMAFERKLQWAISAPPTSRRTAAPPAIPKHVTAKQVDSYKKVYGLEPEQWASMLATQHGRCAICGAHMDNEALVVDHDHATGAVRGLLCRKCNSGLGMFKDSLQNLAAAVNYLVKSSTS